MSIAPPRRYAVILSVAALQS